MWLGSQELLLPAAGSTHSVVLRGWVSQPVPTMHAYAQTEVVTSLTLQQTDYKLWSTSQASYKESLQGFTLSSSVFRRTHPTNYIIQIVDYGGSYLQPLISEKKWNWSYPLGILNQMQKKKLVLSKQELVINVTRPRVFGNFKII